MLKRRSPRGHFFRFSDIPIRPAAQLPLTAHYEGYKFRERSELRHVTADGRSHYAWKSERILAPQFFSDGRIFCHHTRGRCPDEDGARTGTAKDRERPQGRHNAVERGRRLLGQGPEPLHARGRLLVLEHRNARTNASPSVAGHDRVLAADGGES